MHFPVLLGRIDPARCPGGSSTPGLCRINLFFFFLWLWWEGGFDFCSVLLDSPSLFFGHEGNSSSIPSRREFPHQKACVRSQKLSDSTCSGSTNVLS